MRFIGVFFLTNLTWMILGQTQNMTMPTEGQIPGYSISLETIYTDAYIFRGRVLDPEPSFQEQLVLGFGRFSYNLFHHGATEGIQDQFKEYSHAVEYTTVAGNSIQTMGYRYYDYDAFRTPTQEFFYRVSHLTAWHPTYGMAYDIDTYRGYYLDISLSRPMQLSRRLQLVFSLSGALSYDMEEKSTRQGDVLEAGLFADDGFSHADVRAVFVWRLSCRMSMDAGYAYHRSFDDLLKDDPITGKDQSIWQASLKFTLP